MLELHKRRKAVTEPEARYFMMQLLNGCRYLHNNRVIHRDLKLGNIFLSDDMMVKIGNLFACCDTSSATCYYDPTQYAALIFYLNDKSK